MRIGFLIGASLLLACCNPKKEIKEKINSPETSVMNNKDLEAFKTETPWFFNENPNIELNGTAELEIGKDFRSTFPELFKLISKARTSRLTINDQEYIFFAWDNQENEICGWLCKTTKSIQSNSNLIEEHKLLLQTIGGIQEVLNDPEGSFTNNQNFLFIDSECTTGIGDWYDYYSETCEEEGMEQMNHSKLTAFIEEANGDLTLYDPATKKVLLFAHDHSFENVKPIEGQPEYTFHTFTTVDTFTDYVEELAKQWLEVVM